MAAQVLGAPAAPTAMAPATMSEHRVDSSATAALSATGGAGGSAATMASSLPHSGVSARDTSYSNIKRKYLNLLNVAAPPPSLATSSSSSSSQVLPPATAGPSGMLVVDPHKAPPTATTAIAGAFVHPSQPSILGPLPALTGAVSEQPQLFGTTTAATKVTPSTAVAVPLVEHDTPPRMYPDARGGPQASPSPKVCSRGIPITSPLGGSSTDLMFDMDDDGSKDEDLSSSDADAEETRKQSRPGANFVPPHLLVPSSSFGTSLPEWHRTEQSFNI